jgi:hypothetical protein
MPAWAIGHAEHPSEEDHRGLRKRRRQCSETRLSRRVTAIFLAPPGLRFLRTELPGILAALPVYGDSLEALIIAISCGIVHRGNHRGGARLVRLSHCLRPLLKRAISDDGHGEGCPDRRRTIVAASVAGYYGTETAGAVQWKTCSRITSAAHGCLPGRRAARGGGLGKAKASARATWGAMHDAGF